jgi:hypothetical protein
MRHIVKLDLKEIAWPCCSTLTESTASTHHIGTTDEIVAPLHNPFAKRQPGKNSGTLLAFFFGLPVFNSRENSRQIGTE